MKKRIVSALLCCAMAASMFVGCGQPAASTPPASSAPADTSASEPADKPVNVLAREVKEIDDLPDWTGDKVEVSVWVAHGTDAKENGKSATNDVFRKELERVTGIVLSPELSFDNNGETADVKVAKMVATKSWPDIAINIQDNLLTKLDEAGVIMDLDAKVKERAVNYMDIINLDASLQKEYEDTKMDGKLLSWKQVGNGNWLKFTDGFDATKYSGVLRVAPSRDFIYVRDDVTKKLYPESRTQAEIEQLYVDQGYFTAEDMTDIVIRSPEELRSLLEQIKEMGLKEGNKEVFPFYTHDGGDNFNLLANLSSLYGGGSDTNIDYFMYWDPVKKEMVRSVDQPWFKEQMHFFTGLVQDGLASKEALIDNNTVFTQKKNNGEYAVIYGYSGVPSKEALEAGGKDYNYRKVMIDIPLDTQKFTVPNNMHTVGGWGYTFFKNDKMTDEVVNRLVDFIDLFYSEAGQKFSNWGPAKGGLYTENADGTRVYKDAEFARDMVYTEGRTDIGIDVGFGSWPSLDYFAFRNNPYHGSVIGDKTNRNPDAYSKAFNYALIEPIDERFPRVQVGQKVWSWGGKVEGVAQFWDARQAYEDAVKKVFTATNDEEFEMYFKEMQDVATANGLTEETMKEVTKLFIETEGQEVVDQLSWAVK